MKWKLVALAVLLASAATVMTTRDPEPTVNPPVYDSALSHGPRTLKIDGSCGGETVLEIRNMTENTTVYSGVVGNKTDLVVDLIQRPVGPHRITITAPDGAENVTVWDPIDGWDTRVYITDDCQLNTSEKTEGSDGRDA